MSSLTDREREILEALKTEPMLSQEDLAARLGITRSAAAVHISNLLKKGYILGRGYVFNEQSGIVVIGETCLETVARLDGVPEANQRKVQGRMDITMGGSGRNVAEVLARLKVPTTLITAVGQDQGADQALSRTARAGVNVNYVLRQSGLGTAKNLVVSNERGKRVLEVEDKAINRTITPGEITKRAHLLLGSQIVVVDSAVPANTVAEIFNLASTAGARKVFICSHYNQEKDNLDLADVLILDKNQALGALNLEDESLTGEELCTRVLQLGPKIVLIIMDAQELYLGGQGEGFAMSVTPGDRVNLLEVRDILTGGFIHGFVKGYGYRQALRFGLRVAQGAGSSSEGMISLLDILSLEETVYEG